MKNLYCCILCFLFTCFIIQTEAQETISTDARKFCNQLKLAASANTVRRVDSVVRTYRSRIITEKDLMNIANSMTRGGDGAMAIALYICFTIGEASAERALEQKQGAIILLNDLYKRHASRREQILRNMN